MDLLTIFNSGMTALQIGIAVFMFAWHLPRRPWVWARLPLFLGVLTLFLMMVMPGAFAAPPELNLPLMLVIYALVLLYCVVGVLVVFDANVWQALFCATAGYTLQNLASGLAGPVSLATAPLGLPRFLDLFVSGALCVLTVYTVCYFLLVKKTTKGNFSIQENRGMLAMLVVVIIAVIGFDIVIKDAFIDDILRIDALFMRLVHVVVCCFILYSEYEMLYNTNLKSEMAALEQLAADERHQYELSKQNIESINVKVHDIRHQIRHIADNQSVVVSPDVLNDIAQEVRVYDSWVHTGNEALDVILTERSLACEGEGIVLMCMADGKAVSFMRASDVYSLFGNALENAMEAVQRISDPEKKRIMLVLRRDRGMTSIHIENYCETELDLRDGVPHTTKEDADNHGYGITSMRRIAEQYGGTLAISQLDDVFALDILMPLEQKDQHN